MRRLQYISLLLSPFLCALNGVSQPLNAPQRYAFTAQIEDLGLYRGESHALVSYPSVEKLLEFQAEGKIPYIVAEIMPKFTLRLHIQSESIEGTPLQKGTQLDFGIHSPSLFLSEVDTVDIVDGEFRVKAQSQKKNFPFILLVLADKKQAMYRLVFDRVKYLEENVSQNFASPEQMKTYQERIQHIREHEEATMQELEESLIEYMKKKPVID